ncbi:DUF4294 domain-containing protein [Tenacibaculum sp. 1B UA]|uniref:DUF4294 domain-containing protein n=1 Tax=Tenacibaculum sp. 1B UA TaxID=2922252 RepID=UPI002A242038|nr:DUF4294 domain-containing protein [Tenacibaculum sp. 1B UA]MDX8554980.1 DUF4294 domain-containing protein [Tenacibaculum sp. 1B UA]
MKKLLYLYLLLFATVVNAQIKDTLPNFNDEYILIREGDSLMIKLNEVTVLPRHKFKDKKDILYYYWLRKKVFKAYPYAILAAKRVDSVNSRLARVKSKSKKRKYIKRIQKYLEEELTAPLKKLTRTEGRILLKLIHRQTGKTAFDNVRELRSGWKAFWYNTTANLFKLSLKSEYKPEIENEDYLVEDILQRAYIEEKLEYQEPKLVKNYLVIVSKSRGYVDVSEYKEMFSKMRKKRKGKKK